MIRSFFLMIIACLAIESLSAQWTQLGTDVLGLTVGDQHGYAIDLDSAGTTMIVGSAKNDSMGNDAGVAIVYSWDGTQWIQKGQPLFGASGDEQGRDVSISSNGNRIAIGAPFNDGNGSNSGEIKVYDWTGFSWSQIGQDLNGEGSSDLFGGALHLSANGLRLVTSAPGFSTYDGQVKVFELVNSLWSQVGNTIQGSFTSDNVGSDVALDRDGDRMVIGSGEEINGQSLVGNIKVYELINSTWTQLGSAQNGDGAWHSFGAAVAINDSGTVVAASNDQGLGPWQTEYTRVFEWSGTDWIQKGADISSEFVNEQRTNALSMSGDGFIVSIGCPGNDSVATEAGEVRVYEWNGSTWAQLNQGVEGNTSYDRFGFSVALNHSGSIYAAGATSVGTGRAEVYAICIPTFISIAVCDSFELPFSNTHIYTNGSYLDTTSSVMGCDSIVTFNVVIGTSGLTTLSVITCDSYVNPISGDTIFNTSTLYDTLTNITGCDSVIMTAVTIANNDTNFALSVCDSFTLTSGSNTYFANGLYLDTLTNSFGCDSILTISLTIMNDFSALTEVVCDSFVLPSGNQTFYSSGLVYDTLQNSFGCDSVLAISLIINYTQYDTVSISECDSYLLPNGSITTSDTLVVDSLQSALGCDSLVFYEVEIRNSSDTTLNVSACDSYLLPSGTLFVSQTGVYSDFLVNSDGCDSNITINFTRLQTDTFFTAQGCNSYETPSAKVVTNSGTVFDTLINAHGCDSLITISVSITTLDTGVNRVGVNGLIATQNSAEYQWLDCDNSNLPIWGETNQNFQTQVNGSFAVKVSFAQCTDTSSCYDFTTLTVPFRSSASDLVIFPNPSSDGRFEIQTIETHSIEKVEVMDLQGRNIKSSAQLTERGFQVDLPSKSGVYLVKIILTDGNALFRQVILK